MNEADLNKMREQAAKRVAEAHSSIDTFTSQLESAVAKLKAAEELQKAVEKVIEYKEILL